MTRLVLLLFLCVLPVAAASQAASFEPQPGDLWVTFDELGSTLCATPPPFTTDNHFWVVTYGLQIEGYEFAVTVGDPNIIIFAASDVTNPGGSINVGTPPLEWTVGVGFCTGDPEVLQLVQFTYGYFVQTLQDVLICLGPADPASIPGVPAYLDCAGNIAPLEPLGDWHGIYPNGCGVLYPFYGTCDQVIPVASSSWSALKSTY